MKMKMDNVHLSLRLPLAQKRGVVAEFPVSENLFSTFTIS